MQVVVERARGEVAELAAELRICIPNSDLCRRRGISRERRPSAAQEDLAALRTQLAFRIDVQVEGEWLD